MSVWAFHLVSLKDQRHNEGLFLGYHVQDVLYIV